MTPVQPLIKRFRIASSISGTTGLLLAPCILLSVTFFFLDERYRFAVHGPFGGTSMSADYRSATEALAGSEGFHCRSGSHRVLDVGSLLDPRDVELVAMQRAMSAVYEREVMLTETGLSRAIWWVEELDLLAFRRASEIRRRFREGSTPLSELYDEKISPYCREQDHRRAAEEETLPPIQIAGEIRALLLRAADRMDEAVRAYEEVRPWLLVFFYTWIAYSVIGLFCAFYVVRLTEPYAKAIRAQREAAGLPPW